MWAPVSIWSLISIEDYKEKLHLMPPLLFQKAEGIKAADLLCVEQDEMSGYH